MKTSGSLASNPDHSIETEYRIRRKDGENKRVREGLQTLPIGSKMPEEIHGFIRDITKCKKAEETLKKI
jgi:PAS domain S-box-containing protein